MKTGRALAIAASVAAVLSIAILAQASRPAASKQKQSLIARGKYIVDSISMCSDCHTPRLQTGALDMKRYLKGSDLAFKPTHPMGEWESHAPDITSTGKGRWGESRLARFLTHADADPPMPAYRMNTADAKAVAAYLVSLK